MQFDVREVAGLMGVPESKVYLWINEQNLPARQVNGKYRVDRAELLEWATINHLDVCAAAFSSAWTPSIEATLGAALAGGVVAHNLPCSDKRTALAAVVQALPLPEGFDRPSLVELFLSREALGSTALGDGIAVPHPCHPVVLPGARASLSICFLDQPLDFGAADRRPVSTLLVLVCPTIRMHLELLARIARLLGVARFREALGRRASREEIATEIARVENGARDTLTVGTAAATAASMG